MGGLLLIEVVLALTVYGVARWTGRRSRPLQVPLVLASAAPVLVSGVWGRVFWVVPGSAAEHPAWIAQALAVFFYASIVFSLTAVVFSKGYRIPAAAFALPQILVAWFVGFLGVMEVTGVWI